VQGQVSSIKDKDMGMRGSEIFQCYIENYVLFPVVYREYSQI